MMIIDVHAHLGEDRVFDASFREAEQWNKMTAEEQEQILYKAALNVYKLPNGG